MEFQAGQRVRLNLAGFMVGGVGFGSAVTDALASVVRKISDEPSVYLVQLVFSFKGLSQVEVPAERIRPA
ncbi:MAG: hypothetical protein M3Y07_05855 [Acidobacteriota bacterium]|nr:hypothetical protein [Acidobacteriota bacterium]